MTRSEWLELFKTGNGKKHIAGVIYTREQVDEILQSSNKSIVEITYHRDDHDFNTDVAFFTNNHIFAYPYLGDKFGSCTMAVPPLCIPRPGCEDGVMNTFEKYSVVHKRSKTLWSEDELIDFLETLGMVEKD